MPDWRVLPVLTMSDWRSLPALTMPDWWSLPALTMSDWRSLPALTMSDWRSLPALAVSDRRSLPALTMSDWRSLPALAVSDRRSFYYWRGGDWVGLVLQQNDKQAKWATQFKLQNERTRQTRLGWRKKTRQPVRKLHNCVPRPILLLWSDCLTSKWGKHNLDLLDGDHAASSWLN